MLLIFFLKIVEPKYAHSLLIHPNEPYAYISGDFIEVSPRTSNVIIGGLSNDRAAQVGDPKFPDVVSIILHIYSNMLFSINGLN